MASKRCGCASDQCACVVTSGIGVEVSGSGTKTNPYVVDLGSGDLPVSAHAATHAAAGSDPVSLSDSQIAPVAPNDQTGFTYTFVAADRYRLVRGNNAAAQTFTVPPNTGVAFPLGSALQIAQQGAGQITLGPGTGVTLRQAHGLKTYGQYAVVTAIKVGTDEWYVTGDTVT
jgi:hypothetical protein